MIKENGLLCSTDWSYYEDSGLPIKVNLVQIWRGVTSKRVMYVTDKRSVLETVNMLNQTYGPEEMFVAMSATKKMKVTVEKKVDVPLT